MATEIPTKPNVAPSLPSFGNIPSQSERIPLAHAFRPPLQPVYDREILEGRKRDRIYGLQNSLRVSWL
jgi:hypothetical protein